MADARDLDRLRAAATALGELAAEVVFVGGSITSLLITDPAAPPTRETVDVDVIVNVATRRQYHLVEARLRSLGFGPAGEPVVCRWVRGSLVIDVMPLDPDVLGFSNRWYKLAYDTAATFDLGGMTIRIIHPALFVATKLEAFGGRGGGDFQASKDLEDIIAVIDGRASIAEDVTTAAAEVREFVSTQVATLIGSDAFRIAVSGHVGGDSERAAIVLERLHGLGAGGA